MLNTHNSIFNCVGKINKRELYDISVVKAEIDRNNHITNCFRNDEYKNFRSLFKLFGIMGFSKNKLLELMKFKQSVNEKKLSIEQMRIIDNKFTLKSLLIKGSVLL